MIVVVRAGLFWIPPNVIVEVDPWCNVPQFNMCWSRDWLWFGGNLAIWSRVRNPHRNFVALPRNQKNGYF